MTFEERLVCGEKLLEQIGTDAVRRMPGGEENNIPFEIKVFLSLCEGTPTGEEYPAFGRPTEVSVGCFGLTAGGKNFTFNAETQKLVHESVVRDIYENAGDFSGFREKLRLLNSNVQTDFSQVFRDEHVRQIRSENRNCIRETKENLQKQYGLNNRYNFFQTFAFRALPESISEEKRLAAARYIADTQREYLSLKRKEEHIRKKVRGGMQTPEYRDVVRNIQKHRTELLRPEIIQQKIGVEVSSDYCAGIISCLDKKREEFFSDVLRESGEFTERELEAVLRYPKYKLVVVRDINAEITELAKERYSERRQTGKKGEFSEQYDLFKSKLHHFAGALSMEKARAIQNRRDIEFPCSIASAYFLGKNATDICVDDKDIRDSVAEKRVELTNVLAAFLHSRKDAKQYVERIEWRYREFYDGPWFRRCAIWARWGDMPRELYRRLDSFTDEQTRKSNALIQEEAPLDAHIDVEEIKKEMFRSVYRSVHNQDCPMPLYVYMLPTGLVGIDAGDRVSILPVHPMQSACTQIFTEDGKAAWRRCWAAARRKHFRDLDTIVRGAVMDRTSEIIRENRENCPGFYPKYLRLAEKHKWPQKSLLNPQNGCFRPQITEEDWKILETIPDKYLAHATDLELMECRSEPGDPEKLITDILTGSSVMTMSLLKWESDGRFSLRLRFLRKFLEHYEPEAVYAFLSVCIANAVFDSLSPEQKARYRARQGTRVNISKAQFHTLFNTVVSDAKKRSEILVRALFISEYRKKYLMLDS